MRATPIQADPPDILEAPKDGGEGGGLLWNSITGSVQGDSGRFTVLHHVYCGGECGCVPLGDGSY